MTRPAALLLDLDGVLVDTETPALDALAATLADYGVAMRLLDVDAQFRGRNLDHSADLLGRLFAGDVPLTFVDDARAAARARLAAAAEPGARAILGCGICLRVVTNSTVAQAFRTLVGAGLADLVDRDAIIGVDLVARPKPDPEIYHAAIDALAVPANACLAVEDSLLGLEAATAAGTRTVGCDSRCPQSSPIRSLPRASVHGSRCT